MARNFILTALPGTGNILALSLLDDFLTKFLLKEVLEVPQTAIHVQVAAVGVFLRSSPAIIGGTHQFSTGTAGL